MKKAAVLTITEDTEEIKSLLQTLKIDVVKEFLQKRDYPHAVSFLGPGKIDEVFEEIKDLDIDIFVVNGSLKPSQHHYLEMKFQKEFIDRTGVILRIFSDHAHTPEAIAQVTLAKLRYEQPFLREWIHKAKSGDRPGFLAGGAYATDVYYEHAKTHARRMEASLEELSDRRQVTRAKRREMGFSLVSLAGYTNAGKSALMNKMCNASVEVDDRLFSTLSTTTRRVAGLSGNVLMSDTVGFIRDLPPNLVDAFNSTLEEIFHADLILLVFDASELLEPIGTKLTTSLDILRPKIGNRPVVVVGNKIDAMKNHPVEEVNDLVLGMVKPFDLVFVSAKRGDGLDVLRERISKIEGRTFVIDAELPITDTVYSLLSRIRSIASVHESVQDSFIDVSISCRPDDSEKIQGWLESTGGKNISAHKSSSEEEAEPSSESTGNEGAPLTKQ